MLLGDGNECSLLRITLVSVLLRVELVPKGDDKVRVTREPKQKPVKAATSARINTVCGFRTNREARARARARVRARVRAPQTHTLLLLSSDSALVGALPANNIPLSLLILPLAFARLHTTHSINDTMLNLEIDDVGTVPISLDGTLHAAQTLTALAARRIAGKVHRAEPLPPAGSNGPPYALVQFSLSGLDKMKHEGSGTKIRRGDVCHIGGTSDLFVSLARGAEHDGWEQSMTIIGRVEEPQLTDLVEGAILALPKHDFKHPQYGTVMSMLDKERPCRLVLAQDAQPR